MSTDILSLPAPFITGIATSAGLIVAIGAQNAFVLSQGLRREYHWPIAAICGALDTILILVGIMGMGLLLSSSEFLMGLVTWIGFLFLLAYGAKALVSSIRKDTLAGQRRNLSSLKSALLTTLALSLLNPHVYLDTVVLLGSIGGRYPLGERYWFGAGAALFSFIWFFTLSLGAQWLSPLFKKPIVWRILDLMVFLMMWTLAVLLISGYLNVSAP